MSASLRAAKMATEANSPKQSADLDDVLKRKIALLKSVSGDELIKGNRITLLVDSPATYTAMLMAIQQARNHISEIFSTGVFSCKSDLGGPHTRWRDTNVQIEGPVAASGLPLVRPLLMQQEIHCRLGT